MGRAAARVFAVEGARVFGCDVDANGEARTAELVRDAGGTIGSLAPVGISTAEGAEQWVAAAI